MKFESLRLPAGSRGGFSSLAEFKLQNQIGEGGFSSVFLARHLPTGERVALKRVDLSKLYPANQVNVEREVEAHTRFSHRFIVRMLGFFGADDELFLVLELCPAGNLFSFVNRHGLLRLRDVQKVFGQTLLAVDYVHRRGYIIRDLKPENMLVSPAGDIKLCDFGWCAPMDDLAYRCARAGTFAYMSPESLRGEPQDEKSDVWALGILLYELFVGREPYPGQSHREQLELILAGPPAFPDAPPVHPLAREIVLAALRIEPARRPSVEELLRSDFLAEVRGELPGWERAKEGLALSCSAEAFFSRATSAPGSTWSQAEIAAPPAVPVAPSLQRLEHLAASRTTITSSPDWGSLEAPRGLARGMSSSPQLEGKQTAPRVVRRISIEPTRSEHFGAARAESAQRVYFGESPNVYSPEFVAVKTVPAGLSLQKSCEWRQPSTQAEERENAAPVREELRSRLSPAKPLRLQSPDPRGEMTFSTLSSYGVGPASRPLAFLSPQPKPSSQATRSQTDSSAFLRGAGSPGAAERTRSTPTALQSGKSATSVTRVLASELSVARSPGKPGEGLSPRRINIYTRLLPEAFKKEQPPALPPTPSEEPPRGFVASRKEPSVARAAPAARDGHSSQIGRPPSALRRPDPAKPPAARGLPLRVFTAAQPVCMPKARRARPGEPLKFSDYVRLRLEKENKLANSSGKKAAAATRAAQCRTGPLQKRGEEASTADSAKKPAASRQIGFATPQLNALKSANTSFAPQQLRRALRPG